MGVVPPEKVGSLLLAALPFSAVLVALTWACFHYTHKSKTLTEVLSTNGKPFGAQFPGDRRLPHGAFLNALAAPWYLLACSSAIILATLGQLAVPTKEVLGIAVGAAFLSFWGIGWSVALRERPLGALPKWYLDECAEDERILAEWKARQQEGENPAAGHGVPAHR